MTCFNFTGSYHWMEKKGVSQCDVDLQFKTNKFDSHITGYIVLSDGSIVSNMHIRYKFEKTKNESFNFEFKFKDQSTKLKSILLIDLQVESTSYPEINLGLNARYQVSSYFALCSVEYLLLFYLLVRSRSVTKCTVLLFISLYVVLF